MAEAVHLRLEGMIPEIEDISKLDIFSKDEIKAIISNRERYEYMIQRRQLKKIDFLSYIGYEMNLEKLIRKRFTQNMLSKKKGPPKVCYSITSRINGLYQRLLRKFKADEGLWIQYINWCKSNKSTRIMGRGLLQAIEYHPRSVDLWIMAAKWQLKFNSSPSASRALFQKGLRFNENNKILWVEYFKMELLFAKKIVKQNKIKDTNLVKEVLEVPKIVFDSALKKIPNNLEFALEFLNVSFSSRLKSTELSDHIQEYLKNNFPDDPKALSAIFSAKLKYLSLNSTNYPFVFKQVVECFQKELNSRFTAELAQNYFNFLFNYSKEIKEENMLKYIKRRIVKHCNNVSERKICTATMALNSKTFVDEKLYKTLIEVALECDKLNVELWMEVLNVTKNEGNDALESLFEKALHTLINKPDLKRVWTSYFEWKKSTLSVTKSPQLSGNGHLDYETGSSDSDLESDNEPEVRSVQTLSFTHLHDRFLEFMKTFNSEKICIDDVIETYATCCFQIFGADTLNYAYSSLINTFKTLRAKFYSIYTHLMLTTQSLTLPSSLDAVRKIWFAAISPLESSSLVDYENAVSIWIGFVTFELLRAKSKTNSLGILARARKHLSPSSSHLLEFENLYRQLLKQEQ